MNFPRPILSLALILLCTAGRLGAQEPAATAAPEATEQIKTVLTEQAAAWNAGDVDRFMQGYAKSPDLRFASGGNVTYGWQATLDGYKKRYPDRKAMGALTFSELDVKVLSADAALVFGRWRLVTGKQTPNGLFTLLFRRTPDGWRIVADHTSLAAER